MKSVLRLSIIVVIAGLMAGCSSPPVQRFGSVIGVKKESIPEYKRLHANAWPGVLKMIHKANIRNYSIYLAEIKPDEFYLFSYFEYVGNDFKADMAKIGKDETTKQWWKHTDPLQQPLETRKEGEWWANWEEVFRYQGPPEPKCEHPKRFGTVIGIPKESILAYTQLHAAPWPGVIEGIEKANIRNYSIYLGELAPNEYYLFSYNEYVGDDFEGDMAKSENDAVSKEWWKYTDPLQRPIPTRKSGEHWHTMEEVFHAD